MIDRHRLLTVYCLLLGLSDLLTGVLLLAVPALMLKLMLIPAMPAEPIYLRWVGVFVMATGSYYLLPFRLADARRRRAQWRVVFELTALVRMLVALFVFGAIATGSLTGEWVVVGCFDAAASVVQLVALRKRWLDD